MKTKIIATISDFYETPASNILCRKPRGAAARAKKALYYVANYHLRNVEAVCDVFGIKNKHLVRYNIRTAQDWYDTDKSFSDQVNILIEKCLK